MSLLFRWLSPRFKKEVTLWSAYIYFPMQLDQSRNRFKTPRWEAFARFVPLGHFAFVLLGLKKKRSNKIFTSSAAEKVLQMASRRKKCSPCAASEIRFFFFITRCGEKVVIVCHWSINPKTNSGEKCLNSLEAVEETLGWVYISDFPRRFMFNGFTNNWTCSRLIDCINNSGVSWRCSH